MFKHSKFGDSRGKGRRNRLIPRAKGRKRVSEWSKKESGRRRTTSRWEEAGGPTKKASSYVGVKRLIGKGDRSVPCRRETGTPQKKEKRPRQEVTKTSKESGGGLRLIKTKRGTIRRKNLGIAGMKGGRSFVRTDTMIIGEKKF